MIIRNNGRKSSSDNFLERHSRVTRKVFLSSNDLKVDIPTYKEEMTGGKQVVFFQVLVRLGKREWELHKRYSQFESLDTDLRAKHPQLPKLPGKTFFRLQAKEDIGKRREDLNSYLRDIVNRQDLRTNSHFREFLELDSQIPESVVNTPVKVAELPELNLGGRDFVLLREEGLLFIAESDMNVASRLDSYLTNVSLFEDERIVHLSLGETWFNYFCNSRGSGSLQDIN